jgi:hypothetical protein
VFSYRTLPCVGIAKLPVIQYNGGMIEFLFSFLYIIAHMIVAGVIVGCFYFAVLIIVDALGY